MGKITLKKHLLTRRIFLYEKITELQEYMRQENFTIEDTIKLELYQDELNSIKLAIKLCEDRKKF